MNILNINCHYKDKW